jgi:3-deoxy-7-phosphoheptulonate synthase
MERLDDLNIASVSVLPAPGEVKREIPLSEVSAGTAAAGRHVIEAVLRHKDRRHIVICGPCSIHSIESSLDYARRLKGLADRVSERLLVVMRAYVEKPRTTVGWKGLIYDPDLDDSCDIARGIRLARRLMCDITAMGLPVGTEVLDPVMPQYLADLVSWGVIGARTTESQTHRQLVSGLSMPTGFKNPTNGNIRTAIEAIKTAAAPHSFLGVTSDGLSGFFRTRGNKFGHLVLRGGSEGPNYGAEHVAYAHALMEKMGIEPAVIVDCSHANSGKSASKQAAVMKDVIGQVCAGESAIVGTMLESYLVHGKQDARPGKALKPDVSVTDDCIGWEETEELLMWAFEKLRSRKG